MLKSLATALVPPKAWMSRFVSMRQF
jgi:hypothetical protein